MLRFTVIIIGIIVIAWLLTFVYFKTHKQQILEKTISAIRKNVSGTVTISDIDLDFPSTFPYLSVELNNIVIKDSLFNTHKHELLRARAVYLQVNPFSLITGNFSISRLVAEEGMIYIFEDGNGYSNLAALERKQENKSGEKNKKQINIVSWPVGLLFVIFVVVCSFK